MDKKIFKQWLEKYLRQQEKKNPEVIKDLFADDGVYWWGPFNQARQGSEDIYRHHRNALSHQENIKYDYQILACQDDFGIARFHLTLDDTLPDQPNIYDGIFLVHLNKDGKCTLFQEWYHSTKK